MEGYEEGDVCNRDKCRGIILQHDTDGSCSCHVHPPCGHCTTPREYCPSCGWDSLIEQEEQTRKMSESESEYWAKWRKDQEAKDKEFYDLYNGKEPVSELIVRSKSHTHFSMIKFGMAPLSMTKSQLFNHVKGTFGGRFTRYNDHTGRFEFIAYTD